MMRTAGAEVFIIMKTMGRIFALVIVAVLLFMLGGCGTTNYVSIENHNEGNGTLVAAADNKAELDGEQNSALGLEGSVPNIGGLMDRINPILTKPTTVDNSQTDSNNPTSTTTNTTNNTDSDKPVKDEVVADQTDQGNEEPSDKVEYNTSKVYKSYGVRNGRQAWRITQKGPEFGKTAKFVFSSGKEFTVKDTEYNCRDREDTCKRDSSSDMYGFVFKPGIGPNGDGDADRGTSHGGVYLHAPWKDTSKSVKVYYNK